MAKLSEVTSTTSYSKLRVLVVAHARGVVLQNLARAQIETGAGVENAREIAEVDGVDVIFIGPTDLSGSMRFPNQTGAPEVDRQIRRAMEAALAAGKPLATVPRVGRSSTELFDEGFRVPDRGSGNPTPLGGWDGDASGVDWLHGRVQAWQPHGMG
ncbi:aldolase/citrate lyase family protein, partial [Mesorhizobium sp. LHD-90]|uniref:aldolase/citrate lyase family protein n=1 Tax=Mesorhizobium sp. LHD-90 TaxID=3071414 RepID=UPI0027E0BB5B